MKRYLALFVLTCFSTAASAQEGDLFCNAGLHPNGFIDLSKLPPSPNFPPGQGSSNSSPITVTLPVTGVAGLTVQLTIPALQGQNLGSPVYTVAEGTLTINGTPVTTQTTTGPLLIFQFNAPVAGLGLVGSGEGRGSSFTLQAGVPAASPPNFQNTANIFTLGPALFSEPLQQVDLGAGFTTASFTGILNGFGPPYASVADLRVQSTAASLANLVPTEGLQQWLSSDSVQSPFTGGATSWPDKSGNGHDATQTVPANEPLQVQGDGNACQGAFSFAGNQYFNFNLPIDGWEQITIFLVSKSSVNPPPGSSTSEASAVAWNENAPWGTTFVSPYQTTVPFRFGTKQAGNQPVYTRPVTLGQDFTLTRAVHDRSTDTLYVNGLLALSQGNKLPVIAGTSGAGYIGKGINNTYFQGEISEILVYNRVLSTEEAASVESYLRSKFAIR